MCTTILGEATWQARRAAHERRVDAWIRSHLARSRRGEPHPVEDFLFTYYSYRPARLRRWEPGWEVTLTGESAREFLGRRGYVETAEGVRVGGEAVRRRLGALRWTRELLAATLRRPAYFGCLGLHEWAMVYRQDPAAVRHADHRLRLGPEGTDAVVERHRIRCSHFDAYRFFTDAARPRNSLRPERAAQMGMEQGGCLHANMDLYKWAYKLAPLLPSELIADCFELAREIRVLDMRASPYDLSSLGYSPVRIETGEGKAEYASSQREFAARAHTLRQRLVDACDLLLNAAGDEIPK